MGNECCQQQKLATFEFDVSNDLKQQDFIKVEFPSDDQYLKDKLKDILQQINTQATMKHLTSEKYYWGHWQEGVAIGKGVLYKPNTFFYEGNFDVKPHSYGTIDLIQEGLIYKGQIKLGKAEGIGELKSKEPGLYHYDGTWKNSEPVTGTLKMKQINPQTNKSQQTIVEFKEFPVGDTIIEYPDGKQYKGIIHHKKLCPDGRGKVIFVDMSQYDGEWSEGNFHGEGTYKWKDGSFYEGSYQYGKKHGFGKYVYPKGNVFQGQWIESKKHGKGILYDRKGDVKKRGIWHQDRFITTDQID